MVVNMKVSDAMSRDLVVITPRESAQECSKRMLKSGVGSIIVQENGILKGIITEKDFIEKIVLKAVNPKKQNAGEIMTTRMITVSPDKNLYEAVRIMNENKVRRLPVVDRNNKVIGMLAHTDIVRIQPALIDLIIERMRIGR